MRNFDIALLIPVLLGTFCGAAIMHLFTTDLRFHLGGAAIGTFAGVVAAVALQRKAD